MMKMIVAFVKPNKFDDIMFALHKIEGLTGASASDVRGFGRDRSKHDPIQKPEISLDFKPHIRLEIACHSERVEQVISTVEEAAHTGLRGDGKIYVFSLEDAVRLSSGERGEDAV